MATQERLPATSGGAELSHEVLEQVVVQGDLSKLTPTQRLQYYKAVCESLGLNPLTKPFDYIVLNGRLTLYARRDATDQLRNLRGISVTRLERERIDDLYVVTAYGQTKDGRTDSSIGAVSIKGLAGDALANAIMKAETKAKRRLTLSLAGLGWLDETEAETVTGAKQWQEDVDVTPPAAQASAQPVDVTPNGRSGAAPAPQDQPITEAQRRYLLALMPKAGKTMADLHKHLRERYGIESSKAIPARLYREVCRWAETPGESSAQAAGGEMPWPTLTELEWRRIVEMARSHGVKPADLLRAAQSVVPEIQRPGQIPAWLTPYLERVAEYGSEASPPIIGSPADEADGPDPERRVTRRELFDLLAMAWEHGIGEWGLREALVEAEVLTPFDVTLDVLKAADLDRAREVITRAGEAARQEEAEAAEALRTGAGA